MALVCVLAPRTLARALSTAASGAKYKVPASAIARALSTAASGATYKVPASAIASFRERGYAVLPNFLSEEEILPIEAIYNRFMSGELAGPGKDFCDMSQGFVRAVVLLDKSGENAAPNGVVPSLTPSSPHPPPPGRPPSRACTPTTGTL